MPLIIFWNWKKQQIANCWGPGGTICFILLLFLLFLFILFLARFTITVVFLFVFLLVLFLLNPIIIHVLDDGDNAFMNTCFLHHNHRSGDPGGIVLDSDGLAVLELLLKSAVVFFEVLFFFAATAAGGSGTVSGCVPLGLGLGLG